MKPLLLNPWTYVAAGAVLLAVAAGSFGAGYMVRGWKCGAGAAKAAAKVEAAEDRRDQNIEAIGTRTRESVHAAEADTRGTADESAARIRTIVMPGPCRDVDPVVLHELDAARDRINAKIGGGVRPGAADAGPAAAED